MDDVLATGRGHRAGRDPRRRMVHASPDGRIAEIRSYYQQRPHTTELDGFPYAERGYSTPASSAAPCTAATD